MRQTSKILIYLVLFTLSLQLLPHGVAAENEMDFHQDDHISAFIYSKNSEDFIPLYEDETATVVLGELLDGTEVKVLETMDDVSFIEYTSDDSNLKGFVPSANVVLASEKDDFLKEREAAAQEQVSENEEGDTLAVDVDNEGQIEELPEVEGEMIPIEEDQDSKIEEEISKKEETEETTEISQAEPSSDQNAILQHKAEPKKQVRMMAPVSANLPTLQGVALQEITHVYVKASTTSSHLKSYPQGQILKFRPYSADWYEATVYIAGKKQIGYINAKDVDVIKAEQERLNGFALKQPVSVYSAPTQNGQILKSYNQGQALIYQSFSSQWYKATVILNGKARTGYIAASDVGEERPIVQQVIKGVALSSPTEVYESPSTQSKSLKAYSKGHILQYRTYNSQWHIATVYVSGQAHTGYIAVKDVETVNTSTTVLKGIAAKSSIPVYPTASTNAKVWKTYNEGHELKYRPFTSEWYEATVYVNGKAQKGYIHANDVEEIVQKQESLKGIAAHGRVKVYTNASKNSKALKQYSYGHGLVYRSYTKNWYEATVYVNGIRKSGYIHNSDVMDVSGKLIVVDAGHGGHDPGAKTSQLLEKDLTLDLAKRTRSELEKKGFTVIMTRSDDVYITLDGRSQIANDSKANLFVSIHINSFNGSAKGIETFWHGKYEKQKSRLLAELLQDRIVQAMESPYRRVEEQSFHVIRETKIPSALVEVGFIDHPEDAAKLKQATYRQRVAEGITNGVIDYFK
ncbi:N-acetylmuramoyl-L-alanine amidase [Bacillus niameyensis]|uniref:N-acetylmuramoyl-L-alanine amidase n=1 Tax=Bacillus niameyensis TaxID=1522308 RepID=UPI00078362BD|nr:N-acetylmuramoyl-L-alanine amidase [Bacillus niameyensis]